MVHEHNLSSVLSEFARTVLTDFRIQAILDRLVERIVDVLSITGAGVTLIAPGMAPQYSEQQREEVLGIGCELAQGFFYVEEPVGRRDQGSAQCMCIAAAPGTLVAGIRR